MTFWHGVSVMGSMAVMGPAGIAVGLWLAVGQCWRLAFNWCVLYAAGMGLVVLSKLVFMGWGIGISAIEFAGFSGHAMRAGAVLPVLGYVALKNAAAPVRRGVVLGGVALAMLISLARVMTDEHTLSEVLLGCLLGLGIAGVFFCSARDSGRLVVSRVLVLASLGALMLTPRVEPVPTEVMITKVALRLSGRPKPFVRGDWKVSQRVPLR